MERNGPRGNRDRSERSDRGDRPERPRLGQRDIDAKVLALRDEGKAFGAIARSVGLKRSADAHRAMLRALQERQGSDRDRSVARELARLDALEARVRARDAEHPDKLARRVEGVEKMRTLLAGLSN